MGKLERHRLHYRRPNGHHSLVGYICGCGYAGEGALQADRNKDVVRHCKAARRWIFEGVEVHAEERYYLWRNKETGRKYAWLAERYWLESVAGSRG